MKLLVIIPAYNEEANIKKTVENLKKNAPQYDYIIINDCSKDKTGEICKENGFNVVHLPCNLGIGGAVQTGFIYAWENGYDLAVQVDGDGQHDAQFLMEMEQYLKDNQCNMVIGSRFIEKEGFQSSFMRRVGIRYFTWLIKLLTRQTITDATSGLRMVDRSIIELFAREYPKDYPEPESTTKVIKKGMKVMEIPVVMKERQGGVSSISPMKSIYYMIKVSLAVILAAF